MQLAAVTPEQAETIVAVLGAVATARGTHEPSPADLAVVHAAADHLLGGPAVPEDLARSIPGVVAEQLAEPATRELTIAITTVLSFGGGDAEAGEGTGDEAGSLDPVRVMVVDDLARYLRASALDVIEVRRVAKQHQELVALDAARRNVLGTGGMPVESRLDIDARRVHALWDRIEQLPTGTVGAELVRYYADNGWRYPGTDHHEPLAVAGHDFHHVLGGYPTTLAGELGVGAFTAGAADRPWHCVVSFLTWAQAGAAAANREAATLTPEPCPAALERGGRTTGAFVAPGWDPWSVVDRDLDALRAEYQVDGGAPLGPGDAYDVDPVTAER